MIFSSCSEQISLLPIGVWSWIYSSRSFIAFTEANASAMKSMLFRPAAGFYSVKWKRDLPLFFYFSIALHVIRSKAKFYRRLNTKLPQKQRLKKGALTDLFHVILWCILSESHCHFFFSLIFFFFLSAFIYFTF